MSISRLDIAYRKILLSKYFTKGWGKPSDILKLFEFRKIISNRDTCYKLVEDNYPITIINRTIFKDCNVYEGTFISPIAKHLPNMISPKVAQAYFQLVLPTYWHDNFKPVCIHLAGTGDHFFWRRRNLMAKPLLKRGIASLILENPFYGLRKPDNQVRSCLHYVSDIFIMGGCLILESIALLNWLEKAGFGPLGLTGISMGGHMASLAATNWPKPIVLVPCLSWSTASSVFTEGVMSESINWNMLQRQYISNNMYYESLAKRCNIVDKPFCSQILEQYDVNEIWDDLDDKEIKTPFEILNLMNSNDACLPKKRFSLKDNRLTKDILYKVNKYVKKKRDKEAVWFMRGIMDECTHLKNFSVPFDTSLIIAVCADIDGYVPRGGLSDLTKLWPGATVKYIKGGHIGACIWHRKMFINCIEDAFIKAKLKLGPPVENIYDFI